MRVTVLLGDKNPTVLTELIELLNSGLQVVGAEADGAQLIAAAGRLQPNAIILDASIPYLHGAGLIDELSRVSPNSRILVLTPSSEPMAAAAGHTAIALHAAVLYDTIAAAQTDTASPEGAHSQALAHIDVRQHTIKSLTARQEEILVLLAQGQSHKQIALALDISPKTVEFHKYRLMAQLHARSTAELVSIGIRRGLVPATDE